jgi:threonine dehydrogenase-like Zn-dependent dehydrogenase
MTGLMRAVAQLGTALNVSVIDVPIPSIVNATDVIVKINATAICGTDLHSYRQPTGSSEQPYLYGHEAIGYITEIGSEVTALSVGDYVVIPDNVDDGRFSYEPDRSGADVFWGGGVLPGLQSKSTTVNLGLSVFRHYVEVRRAHTYDGLFA